MTSFGRHVAISGRAQRVARSSSITRTSGSAPQSTRLVTMSGLMGPMGRGSASGRPDETDIRDAGRAVRLGDDVAAPVLDGVEGAVMRQHARPSEGARVRHHARGQLLQAVVGIRGPERAVLADGLEPPAIES